jgi:inner membrane protein
VDSLTQFALGASVALATVGRRGAPRYAAWKTALIGGMVGTLPDLDSFIDFGDAISNMVRHRAETHGLFYVTLVSPIIAALVIKLTGQLGLFQRWCIAVWLILVTHVGIDLLTIYGTQIAQPFSDHPYGVGSFFVIDPLYTLALSIAIVATVISKGPGRWRWNNAGLALSTLYIAWGLGAHQHVTSLARKHPPTSSEPRQLLVTAAPLNTILWRALVITPEHYYEGWYSFFDSEPRFTWRQYPRDSALIEQFQHHPHVARIAAFSHGFFKLEERDGRLFVTDLRLGLEPFYSFDFDIGSADASENAVSQRVGVRPDLRAGLPWLWQRIQGSPIPLSEFNARP